MRASFCTVLLLCVMFVTSAEARRDDEMEPWQKRILGALESDQESSDKRQPYSRDRAADDGASQAANKARRKYGGKVLAVVPHKGGYRVRLLLGDGRVKTVRIED